MLSVVNGHQNEFESVSLAYSIEKAQLNRLEAKFAPINEEFQAIIEERDLLYRARQAANRDEWRRLHAALALQAWWRSYRIRKALAVKAKKLAKLAKKKGKKGKKK